MSRSSTRSLCMVLSCKACRNSFFQNPDKQLMHAKVFRRVKSFIMQVGMQCISAVSTEFVVYCPIKISAIIGHNAITNFAFLHLAASAPYGIGLQPLRQPLAVQPI